MTRPNIVRADTLDLQDQDNPTAAEHQKPLTNGGLAPHQRAEVHHVLEERSSEEHALADAWNMAGGEITQEPGIIDHAQDEHSEQDHDHDQDHTTNGNGDEGEENGESEDDDMMDRISSSPSIDDGASTALPYHSPPPKHTPAMERVRWPTRTSSLSSSPRNTPTPTRETFNQSCSSTPDSSPFLQTPQHLPLHVRRTGRAASPLAHRLDFSPSAVDGDSERPKLARHQRKSATSSHTSKRHHSLGRYRDSLERDD